VSPTSRLVVNAVLRLFLMGSGLWIAFSPDALPGAPLFTRAALLMLFVSVAILLGEMGQLREHMGMLLKVLRAGAGQGKRDDRDAIDLLIQGLSSQDASTREKAHHHLKRLTRQDMPAKPELWQAWWAAHRESYAPEGGAE
jgi:hypothetical protein